MDADRLTMAFVGTAGETGWSDAAFSAFCAGRGLSPDEHRRLWPRGIRSLAWQFNAITDDEMLRAWSGRAAPGLGAIISRRLADGEALKPAVARLARSDLLHPLDTLLRTAQTADLMLRCRGGYRARSAPGRFAERWLLVLAYSLCVLVWIADTTPDRAATARAVRAALSVMRTE